MGRIRTQRKRRGELLRERDPKRRIRLEKLLLQFTPSLAGKEDPVETRPMKVSPMKAYPMKASYTVEASFLMSITFFVLAGLLICTFYLHDKAVMQAAVCEIVSAGSNAATEEEQKRVIAGLKESLTQKRLMGTRNLSRQESTGKKISASWSGNYPVPGMVMKYFTENSLPVSVSWSSEKIQPADMIRKIRGVRKLIGGGAE